MPLIENRDPTEPTLAPDHNGRQRADADMSTPLVEGLEADPTLEDPDHFTDAEILSYLGQAKRRARNYQQVAALQEWEESESAYRSAHHNRSKYLKPQYKNRSKYFKPKTRSAVFKSLMACSVALFSSSDVIVTDASDDSDPIQRANASLMKEILNQRLNNKTRRSGLPWRQIVLGARQQAQVLGRCASKAYWSYKTVTRTESREEERPVLSGDGSPVLDFATQRPFTEKVTVNYDVVDVIEDKPVVQLFSLDQVLVNPAADWVDPIGSSPDLIVIHPMFADDMRGMMRDNGKSAVKWREVSDDQLAQGLYSDNELMGLRTAREGNGAQAHNNGSSAAGKTLSGQGRLSGAVLEVWENFFTVEGVDYHCWTLKDKVMLSDAVPVSEVYPAFRGQRPYHVGTDMIEPFVLYPESDVHSWQQQQAELNELTNLRMDAMRKSIYPTAKVVAGKNIDYKAVQRQDAQNLILVRDQSDVQWDRAPGPPPSAYQEMNYLNTDFDDLAGIFAAGSVQTNRQLNETVGGMSLISQNANAVSEFKLAMFIDTWVEPVLSQLIALEQYYEDDATLLAVAGKKAKLWQRFGVDTITDELLESQITVSVNAGSGASDPMMRLARFKTAMDSIGPFIAKAVQDGKAELQYDEIASEVFGFVGYRNGSDRFIKFKDGNDQQGLPADKVKELMGAAQQHIAGLQAENEKLKSGEQTKLVLKQMDLADNERDRSFEAAMEQQKNQADLTKTAFKVTADAQMQAQEQRYQMWKDIVPVPGVPMLPDMPKMPRPF